MSWRIPGKYQSSSLFVLLFSVILFSVTLLTVVILTTLSVEAHPPESMVVEYDFDSRTLNVTITHPVSDPTSHFIEKVKVERNNEDILEQKYTSQPEEDTFTYSYTVDAADEDTLEVVAECNEDGEILRQITVHGEERSMNLSHSPSLTELEEGSDQLFNITIDSDGNPVEQVNLTIIPSLGVTTTSTKGESGSYSFTYTAPRVLTDTTVWINLSGMKSGYEDGILSLRFNITDIPGSNVILIDHLPDPISLDEEAEQQLTLYLEADTLPLEGVQLDIHAETGIISGIDEFGGGIYTFMYQAPLVAENLSIFLSVNASNEEYENGSLSIVIHVVNLPEPLTINAITVNNSMETGSNQTVTLYLDSEIIGVEGVTLILNPDLGSTSDILETSGGNYTFTYTATEVIADTHIVINITAWKEGYKTTYLEIPITVFIIPPEPINLLCVKLFPEYDPIVEGTTVNFTIYVLYDCDPFQGAKVEMTHLYGAISNIHDEGGGKFTFSYMATDIENDTAESFTITGIKVGYGELTRTFNYTIVTKAEVDKESPPGDDPGSQDDNEVKDENDTGYYYYLGIIMVTTVLIFIIFQRIAVRPRKPE